MRLGRRGRFRLGYAGRALRSDHPRSLRSWILYLNRPATQEAWGAVADTLRTGEPSFPATHGRSVWEHLAAHPEEEREFADSMQRLTKLSLPSIARRYPWPDDGTVCDVAGGVGTLLAGILGARPRLRGVLVDGPGVLAEAETSLVDVHMLTQCDGGRQRSAAELHGLMRRCDIEPGGVHRTEQIALVDGVAA